MEINLWLHFSEVDPQIKDQKKKKKDEPQETNFWLIQMMAAWGDETNQTSNSNDSYLQSDS